MEILAPATASTYKTAVQSGADAIYFGYGEFNARAGADNFTSSLDEVTSYCHFFGVKAFLTLNIAMKETELAEAEQIIIEAEKANIDAFIVTDLSLVPLIKKHSKAQLHASTQLGIHNSYGVKFAYEMGFDRVVLSREVTLSELSAIGMGTPVDLEFFIHGALCVGFSGACLLSSMLTGNSGNRGRCNQLCRKFYRAYLEEREVAKGYLLSAKDVFMGEEYLEKIANCCVRSGKIEGRLRRAEYIAGATSYYHDIKKGKEPRVSETELKALFNRGDGTPGYFKGKNVIYPFSPAHVGCTVGQVIRVLNPHTALVQCDEPLKRNNGYKLMRKDVEVSGCTATGEVKNGMSVIFCSEIIKVGDCVHLTSDIALKNRLLEQKRRIVIALSVRIVGGEKPVVEVCRGDHNVKHIFDFIAEKADKYPLTEEEIKHQFSKTGDTDFEVHFFNVETSGAFLAKSQLNSMRREILSVMENIVRDSYKREETYLRPTIYSEGGKLSGHFAEISDYDFLTPKLHQYIKNVVYSPEVFDVDECKDFYVHAKKDDNLVWIKPPIYISEHDLEKCKRMIEVFDGVVCNNVGLLQMAKDAGKRTVAGVSLNVFNTSNPLIKMCDDYIISTELNRYEVRQMERGMIYAYGYLPLMYLTFCPRHQVGVSCENCYGKIKYRDAHGSYAITTTKMGKGHGLHALRNSVKTDVGNDIEKDMYFDFTYMDEDIDDVISRYFEEGLYTPLGTNKLHLTRGVK